MTTAEPMQEDAPALMRAGQLKENLEGLSRLEPEVAKRIRQRITEKTLETIEEASRVSWLPVELDIELTEAICAELGERGVFEWARGTLVKSLEGPLLGPMLRTTLKLFGMGPKAVFKLAPRAWKMIFRNCGELAWEEKGPALLHILLKGIPPAFASSRAYLLGLAGSFDAAHVVCRVAGQVTLEAASVARREARFIVAWESASTKKRDG